MILRLWEFGELARKSELRLHIQATWLSHIPLIALGMDSRAAGKVVKMVMKCSILFLPYIVSIHLILLTLHT